MGLFDWARKRRGAGPAAARVVDEHGQPLVLAYREGGVKDRSIDELIGIVKGVLFDGEVSHGEAEMLLRWMEANRYTCELWPARVIYPRLAAALADDHLSADEEGELLALLAEAVRPASVDQPGATRLPLTRPEPVVVFEGRRFCVTGQFASGTRDWVHQQIAARGGVVESSITKRLDYLVIGEIGSRDWAHSTHGRKIEKAVVYAEKSGLVIVSEEHWHRHL